MEGVVEIRSFAWIVEDYPLLLACSFKLRLPRHLICNAPCLQILKIIHNSAQVINTPFRGIRLWGNKNRLKRSPMFAAQYWVAYKKQYQLSTQYHTNWDRRAVFWDRSNCRQVVDPSANFDPTPVFGWTPNPSRSLTLLPILTLLFLILTQLRFPNPSGSLTLLPIVILLFPILTQLRFSNPSGSLTRAN